MKDTRRNPAAHHLVVYGILDLAELSGRAVIPPQTCAKHPRSWGAFAILRADGWKGALQTAEQPRDELGAW